MPKSSSMIWTPSRLSSSSTDSGSSPGSISMLSVISRASRCGGSRASVEHARDDVVQRSPGPSDAAGSWRADTLTLSVKASVVHGNAARQSARARAAVVEHPGAELDDRPVCSARGMNSSGGTRPRCGCCQRTSASMPSSRRSGIEKNGWKCTRSSSRSIAPCSSDSVRMRATTRSRIAGGEALDAPAAALLGAVHRGVGVAQQSSRARSCRRRRRRRCSP